MPRALHTPRRDGIEFPIYPSDVAHIFPHSRDEPAWQHLTAHPPTLPTPPEVAELVQRVIADADTLVVRWLELYADTRERRNRTWMQVGANGLTVVCAVVRGEGSVVTAYIPRRAADIADEGLRHAAAVRDVVDYCLEYRELPGAIRGYGFHAGEVVSRQVNRMERGVRVRVVLRDIRFDEPERWGFRAVGEWWVFDPPAANTLPPAIALRPKGK